MRQYTLALLACLVAPSFAYAQMPSYQVGFGPFVGGGNASAGTTLRHTNGYMLSVERTWELSPGLSLGPRFEFTNAFQSTKSDEDGFSRIGTYDTRIFAAGVSLAKLVGVGAQAPAIYGTIVGGRGYSKLVVDESSASASRESLYSNIDGNYFGAETGAWIPLRGSFGINLALLGNVYDADQSQATGTYEGEELVNGSLSLTQGSRRAGDGSLPDRVTLRSLSAKVALAFGF